MKDDALNATVSRIAEILPLTFAALMAAVRMEEVAVPPHRLRESLRVQ